MVRATFLDYRLMYGRYLELCYTGQLSLFTATLGEVTNHCCSATTCINVGVGIDDSHPQSPFPSSAAHETLSFPSILNLHS